jgi:hypothetical protein
VAFDATDFQRLALFFDELPGMIDHVLRAAGRIRFRKSTPRR